MVLTTALLNIQLGLTSGFDSLWGTYVRKLPEPKKGENLKHRFVYGSECIIYWSSKYIPVQYLSSEWSFKCIPVQYSSSEEAKSQYEKPQVHWPN